MELKQLRSFVVAAEELHFSRAAARLHLAQSALSAQIRRLEAEVGGPLFIRTTRRVALTPAGETLLTEGRAILAAADGTLGRIRALARGEEASLVIASLGPVPGALLSPLLSTFGARWPQVRIEVRAFDFSEMIEGLRDGKADIAFLYGPLDESDLSLTPLVSEPRVVVLPRGHRLANRAWIVPADLEGETFVAQPEITPLYWRDFWMLADQLGHRPPISPYIGGNIEEWLHLIGRGEGIDTGPAIIARYFVRPDVAFVPLHDAPPTTLLLALPRDGHRPMIDEFIELAQQIAINATRNPETTYRAPVA